MSYALCEVYMFVLNPNSNKDMRTLAEDGMRGRGGLLVPPRVVVAVSVGVVGRGEGGGAGHPPNFQFLIK
jgi:hypothetical protein